MFTLHHGFWMYFLTRHHAKVWQFVIGSMLPDYVYIFVLGIMLFHGKISWQDLLHLNPAAMMSILPLFPWAMQMDLVGHSVIFWGIGFLMTLLPVPVLGRLRFFSVGWGTHLFVDELTHGAHANYFFYPLSLFSIHSTVSYWEAGYFAKEFNWVNGTLMGITGIYLVSRWWKKKKLK